MFKNSKSENRDNLVPNNRYALWLVPGSLVVLVALAAILSIPKTAQAGQIVLGCFVDTPNFDVPTANQCSGPIGPTRTASFVVMGINWDPDRYEVTWDSGCTGTDWNWCIAGVNTRRPVTMRAWVLDKDTDMTHDIVATATAESNW